MRPTFTLSAVFIATLLATTWLSIAKPMLPRPAAMTDEALSLADISGFRLTVDPLPKAMTKAGVRDHRYAALITRLLADAEFEIEEEDHLPEVVSRVVVAESDDHPGAIAIFHVLALRQHVHLDRWERPLHVPTATISDVTLTSPRQANASLEYLVRQNVRVLKKIVQMATASDRGT